MDGRTEAEDYGHELIVTWLICMFRVWLGSHGFVGGAEAKFAVAERHAGG